jgi:hypothetical protein
MDTRPCEAVYGLARGADLAVMEATYLSDLEEKAREYGHLTASQAGMIGSECGVGILVLSHYSQRYSSPDELAAEASRFHPEGYRCTRWRYCLASKKEKIISLITPLHAPGLMKTDFRGPGSPFPQVPHSIFFF